MNLISTGTDARDKLISGVDLVANKVKVSLGPSGKNVIIRTIGTTEPFTTKDGATIAKQIDHEDPFVKLAIECVQMVATQSEQQAGDGTTTASVLAQAMVNNWKEIKKSPKFNALEFKRGMSKMASALTHYIETIAIPVKDDLEKIREVAMVSSNHSEELADVVVNAFKNAGDSGVINVQRSKTGETYLKVVDGLVMPISYQHPAYINNKAKETCELNDCFVILTNKKITSVTDNFIEILQICSQAGKDVLIICDEIHDDITDILKASVIDKRIRACHVRALGYGKEQKDVLEDLAVMLDTTAFLDDNAYDWNDIELPELTEEDKEKIEARCAGTSGDEYQFKWLEEVARVKVKHLEKYLPTVKEVVINKTSTSIKVGEQSNEVKEQIRQRIEHLEAAIQERPDVQEYEINVLKQRKSRMSSGIAYINVHANSEMEYVEKQHRIEDCLHSVKWANAKGVIPGGGALLLTLSKSFDYDVKSNPSFKAGAQCVQESLSSVFYQILDNAGKELKPAQVERLINNPFLGYNVMTDQVADMYKIGIVDSAYVTMRAIENAATIIGDIITTEVCIVNPELYRDNRRLL